MSGVVRDTTEDKCAHGCGDDATVQHADGRYLCYPCYRLETGGDNESPVDCPTCAPVVRDTNPDLDYIETRAKRVVVEDARGNHLRLLARSLAKDTLIVLAALRVEVGRREKAETALVEYAEHGSWRCAYRSRYKECVCGLDATMEALGLDPVAVIDPEAKRGAVVGETDTPPKETA